MTKKIIDLIKQIVTASEANPGLIMPGIKTKLINIPNSSQFYQSQS
jgi:hypothetical protein